MTRCMGINKPVQSFASLLSIVLTVSAYQAGWCHTQTIDSLKRLIANETNAETQLRLALEAAETAIYSNPQEAIVFADKALELASTDPDSTRHFTALKHRGFAYRKLGNYVNGIQDLKPAHRFFSRQNDTLQRASIANQLGSMHVFMGYNEEAQVYLNEVYELYYGLGDTRQIAGAINGLAIFYSNINQIEKAEARYREALDLYQQLDDTLGRANVHANLGLLLIDTDRLEEAEYHIMMQGKLDSLLHTQWGLGFFFDFLGHLKIKQGKLQEAYAHHLTALAIREQLESHYNVSESRTNLTRILYQLGKYEDSIEQAELIIADNASHNSLSHLQTAYKTLSDAHEALGNHSTALAHFKSYKAISDSIFNNDILETIAEKDARFELAQQRSTIELLDAENTVAMAQIERNNATLLYGSLALTITVLLSSILGVLLNRYYRQKKHLSMALNDKDILLREIHHRVKNNLQVVSSLLSLQGRSIDNEFALKAINEGKRRVRSMALIHQNLYQNDNLTGVKVSDYLSNLCEELFDAYQVSNDRVELKLEIQDLYIDVDTLVPLGLILNELISNSLKYAFPESHHGILSVSLREQNQTLYLEVADNGIGFDPAKTNTNTFGHKLITSLSKQLKAEITTDTSAGCTTRVLIHKYALT